MTDPPRAAGAMSDPSANGPAIVITKTGEKFPPLKYDPETTPDTSVVSTARRDGQLVHSRRVLQPTKVRSCPALDLAAHQGSRRVRDRVGSHRACEATRLSVPPAGRRQVAVDLQLGSVYNLVEKAQSFQADFILISSWSDARLSNPSAPAMSLYSTSVLDSGQIWSPKLTFANRRDLTNSIEGVVRVYNTGRVQVVQRYLATYAVSLDMRDFPFDTQTFAWNLRSTTFNGTTVKFVPATAEVSARASGLLAGLQDPTFAFSSYGQAAYNITDGIFAGYHLLSISVRGTRIATMSSIFLVFPICVICAVLCFNLTQEPGKDSRLSVPGTVISAVLAFSYVVSNQCPPVSYVTRMHLLMFQTYIYAIVALVMNYYLWMVDWALKQLSANNTKNKTLLQDADWISRKVGSLLSLNLSLKSS